SLLAVETLHLDDLLAARVACDEVDRPRREPELLGEEPDDGVVGATALGSGCHAELPGVAETPDDSLPACSGRDANTQPRRLLLHPRSIGRRCQAASAGNTSSSSTSSACGSSSPASSSASSAECRISRIRPASRASSSTS